MRLPLAFPLAAALLACTEAGTEANTADIEGTWQFTEILVDGLNHISCADTGQYYLIQDGATFAGAYDQRGICQTRIGPVNNADSGSVVEGAITGRTFRFAVPPFCEYEGSVVPGEPNRVTGQGICILEDATQRLKLTGPWEATR
ncbi:MAG: hypothetical protein ACREMV_02375 [Gemmatimonadales bacterium]